MEAIAPVDSVAVTVRPGLNGGSLLAGGKIGNKGGRGIQSKVRKACTLAFARRIVVLAQIADDPTTDATDRIRALDTLGRYGIGTIKEVSTEAVREKLRATLEVLRARLPADQAEAIVSELRSVWI